VTRFGAGRAGGPQAGPVADACVCMALPDADNAGKFTMWPASVSLAIINKGGHGVYPSTTGTL